MAPPVKAPEGLLYLVIHQLFQPPASNTKGDKFKVVKPSVSYRMTCDNQSYLVIFSDSGSSEVPMKMMKNSKTVNNLNSKDPNIFRIF